MNLLTLLAGFEIGFMLSFFTCVICNTVFYGEPKFGVSAITAITVSVLSTILVSIGFRIV